MTWVKGQSGNPGGRPQKRLVTDEIARQLADIPARSKATNLVLMVRALVKTARQVHSSEAIAATKLILSYVEGMPTQKIDIDIREEADRIAAERGIDASRLISLADELKKRKAV